MGCSFLVSMVLLAILVVAPIPHAFASDFCQVLDEKKEAETQTKLKETVDKYFDLTLREHGQRGYSRPLKAQERSKAKLVLEQNFIDKKVQLCMDHLQLADNIKTEPQHWSNSECASAAMVNLVDTYMRKVAQTYDDNQKALAAQQGEHLQELKRLLFDIAKGSTGGLEGLTFKGYAVASAPMNLKFEWIKQEATLLAGEAHRAWGGVDSANNPLVMLNHQIAREAVRAKGQRDMLKTTFHTDGKIPSTCVRKP